MRNKRGFRRGVSVFLGFWLLSLGVAPPGIVAAAETGWPLSRDSEVVLGFGASYTGTDGRSATHRGIDIAGTPGEDVLAPSSGEVRFVGRVPASAGGTQLAATILRPDGVSLTFMPLLDACVSSGDTVSAGQRIAGLAPGGDASSSGTHLHVGARRGDLYLDPMQFLIAPRPTVAGLPAAALPAATLPAAETPTPTEGFQRPAAAASPEPVVAEAPAAAVIVAESPAAALAGEGGEALGPERQAIGAEPAARTASVDGVAALAGIAAMRASEAQAPFAARAASTALPRVSIPLPLDAAGAFAFTSGTALAAAPLPAIGMDSAPAALAAGELLSPSGPTIAAADARALSAQGLRLPSAASVASSVRRVGRAWLLALLGSLAGAGALWPLWRRSAKPHEEELRSCVGPGGTDVATAAGR